MSERIVDVFETVQIQKQHRHTASCDGRARPIALVNPVVQQHSIGQARQKVMLGGVGHPQRHRPADAPVAEDDDCSGRVPGPIVDGGDGVFDRNFSPSRRTRMQFAAGARFGLLNAIAIGLGVVWPSRGVPDLQDFGDGSACRLLPRPACHCFRNDIEEGDVSRDVSANNGIANGVERDLGAFLFARTTPLPGSCARWRNCSLAGAHVVRCGLS